MTKNVLIKIKGLQLGLEEETIEANLQGRYGVINGSHCISYEEKLSDNDSVTKNIIKATSDRVIITKKNGVDTRLEFDPKKITGTVYHTPYGNISLSIRTKAISIKDGPDLLELNLEYSLLSAGSLISDNKVNIKVTPA